ncbi:unnamed protein product, partial [Rangifer tarandus platyrhynchus]
FQMACILLKLPPTPPPFSSVSAKDPAGYCVEKMDAVRLSCHGEDGRCQTVVPSSSCCHAKTSGAIETVMECLQR